MTLLSVEEVRVEFGGIVALADLSFTIDEGQICALIGPNGAGKTTLFNCVSRLYETSAGRIVFAGDNLLRMPAYRVAAKGVARTFQNLASFPALTVVENVMVGAHAAGDEPDPAQGRARTPRAVVARPSRHALRGRASLRHVEARRDRARARRRAQSCCASTNPPRV